MNQNESEAVIPQSQPESLRPWYALGSDRNPARVDKELKRKIIRKSILILTIGILLFVTASSYNNKAIKLTNGGIQAPPTLAALAGGCLGIASWTGLPADEVGWVQQGRGAFLWRTLPPVSGNFNKVAWKTSGYIDPTNRIQPRVSDTLADLYRGWLIVWVARDPQVGSIDNLKPWLKTVVPNGNPILAASWPVRQSSAWPHGKNVVFVSWNHWEACTLFDVDAMNEFRAVASKSKAPGFGLPLTETGPKAVAQTAQLARQSIQSFLNNLPKKPTSPSPVFPKK